MKRFAVLFAAVLAGAPAAALAGEAAQVQDLRQQLLQNPDTAREVMGMQNDPNVQAILGDPETMRAVQSGDLETLLADPKIRALMNDPRVQHMSRELR